MSSFCPDCGRISSDRAKFCISCGSEIKKETVKRKEATSSNEKTPDYSGISENPLKRIPDGTTLQDRYKILRMVGEGGMGRVYEAYDQNFQEKAALKEMLVTATSEEELEYARNLFNNESKILLRLKHPKIPNIYDFFSIGNRCFIAMEFIEGETLSSIINRMGMLNEDILINKSIDICDILSYLHDLEPPVVFRDLKPQNLMVKTGGEIYMIDFGIAREINKMTGTAIGTVGYTAPEVYDKKIDRRSDLYSLGALMHYALSGSDPQDRPPFTFSEYPVGRYRKTIYDWQPILERLLTRRPDDRYSNAAEVKSALEALRDNAKSGDSVKKAKRPPVKTKSNKAGSVIDDDADGWIIKGVSLINLKRFGEALECFEKAISIDPGNAVIWNDIGVALDGLERYEESTLSYERAIEIKPDYINALNNKGLSFQKRSMPAEALLCFDKALEYDPQNIDALTNKAEILKKMKRFAEALLYYDITNRLDPFNGLAWNNKGALLTEMSRFEESIICYDKAIEIFPDYAKAWYNKGLSLQKLNRYEESLVCFDRALGLDPDDNDSRIERNKSIKKLHR